MGVYQSQNITSPFHLTYMYTWPVPSYIEWRTHLYNRFFLCQGAPGQTPQRLLLRRIGWSRRSWTPTAKARPWPRRPHGITSRNSRVRHKGADNNLNQYITRGRITLGLPKAPSGERLEFELQFGQTIIIYISIITTFYIHFLNFKCARL